MSLAIPSTVQAERRFAMSAIGHLARGGCLVALAVLLTGCIWVPRDGGGYRGGGYHEGYYDREHHRYWHDNGWHDCDRDDPHCH
jgi:hypothetical protein